MDFTRLSKNQLDNSATCINLVLKLQPNLIRSHPLNTYGKFPGKLTFLTHVRVRIRRLEMLVFWRILHTDLMDGP